MLKFSLFHEVLDDMTHIPMPTGTGGGADQHTQQQQQQQQSKAMVRSWLVKMSADRLHAVRQLIEYVVQLLGAQNKNSAADSKRSRLGMWGSGTDAHGNDETNGGAKGPITVLTMAVVVGNISCRQFGTSYLSIKHKDLVAKVTPSIAFLIENYHELFVGQGAVKSGLATPATEVELHQAQLRIKSEQEYVLYSVLTMFFLSSFLCL
jgi:hypothetical protein